MAATTAVKERPILFSGEMVQAILAGRKTQTRRVIKPQPVEHFAFMPLSTELVGVGDPRKGWQVCPYGVPGDRLWVRETWQFADWTEDGEPYIRYAADGADILCCPADDWADRAWDTWATLSDPANRAIDGCSADRKWRPSIFLPRWASRITLEITGVRVERLLEISEADKLAEGATEAAPFGTVWRKINTKSPYRWEDNPWAWVVEFRRIDA